MSVRIYQLSKQLYMENKELIALLKGRGLKVDSPSNTIPNIYADALLEEFKDRVAASLEKKEAQGTKKEVKEIREKEHNEKLIAQQEGLHSKSPNNDGPSSQDTTSASKQEGLVQADKMEEKTLPSSSQGLKTPPALPIKIPPAVPAMRGMPAPSLPPRPPVTPSKVMASIPKVEDKQEQAPKPVLPAVSKGPEVLIDSEPIGSSLKGEPAPASRPPAVPSLQKMPGALPPRIPARPLSPQKQGIVEEASVSQNLRKALCKPPIVVRDFAVLLDIKPFRLISELMEMGIFASMNQVIEEEVALRLALKHGVELEIRHRGEAQTQKIAKKVEPTAREAVLESRPPVVCVLGHVDHGKTSLLDAIRRTHVVKGEAGGITQHIGAYQVEHKEHKITFIDTPGHAAFSKMRERGANVTDIAVLVVAADDGFMPQTDEALKFAQKANVPIVVAVNKMDAKGANLDRVKQQLQQRGIASEDWGGETLVSPISALKAEGIPELLDNVLLQAEIMDLKADYKGPVEATVMEAQMEQGLGSTANVIIKEGTLRAGDTLVCGEAYCRVRSMIDDKGKALKQATPATPLKIVGWSSAPEAGLIARVVKNEKEAKAKMDEFKMERKKEAQRDSQAKAPMDVNALFAALTEQKKVLKVLIKADVHGSAEALESSLLAIKSTKVSLEVVGAAVGLISKNDVTLASTTGATIVAFNTKLDNGVPAAAKHAGIRIIQHNIIYELIDQVREAMAELLDPEIKEVKVGAAEVRQIFALSKGTVAGCMVTEGKMMRDYQARLVRKGTVLHEGKVVTLKRFKDDANEVRAGYECGIRIDGYDAYQAKDIIECFTSEKIPASL